MEYKPNVELPWSRKKRRAVKFFMIVSGLLLGLLIGEVALRVGEYSFPTFYTTDEIRGFRLRAGMEGRYKKEGGAFVRINSDGLRDREHQKAKPPGVLRIAVVGDSYAEAFQVVQESAFWVVLERQLRACPALAGQEIAVINFGVSGYGTAQELLTLREHVWDYSPDVVLLTFTTSNDVADNSRALKQTDEIPYFIHRDGKLVLDDSFRNTRAFRWRQSALNRLGVWLRDSSRVLQASHEAHYALKSYMAKKRAKDSLAKRQAEANPMMKVAPQLFPGEGTATIMEDIGIDNLVYAEPGDATWKEAWRVTEGLLILMRDEVEARGVKFSVATLSNAIQVYPDVSARSAFVQRVGARDIFYPDLRIKALGERERITVFTLAPELQAYADRHKTFLHGFGENQGNGHWNVEGHRVAGDLLTEKLCSELSR